MSCKVILLIQMYCIVFLRSRDILLWPAGDLQLGAASLAVPAAALPCALPVEQKNEHPPNENRRNLPIWMSEWRSRVGKP